jgi:hypothetical protein
MVGHTSDTGKFEIINELDNIFIICDNVTFLLTPSTQID